jgi:hypothetical protein
MLASPASILSQDSPDSARHNRVNLRLQCSSDVWRDWSRTATQCAGAQCLRAFGQKARNRGGIGRQRDQALLTPPILECLQSAA